MSPPTRRPPEIRILIGILIAAGIVVVECTPTDKGCWALTLTDPIHNHFYLQSIYERYTAQAGLTLFGLTNRPGSESGALVGLIVGTSSRRE
jgi:hypothetical protein